MAMRQEPGFTLIELMVTIAVAGILLAVAVPSFRATIQNNRVTGQANEFLTSLTMARSEAIKRSTPAYVCVSSDQATCTGSNWAGGWLIGVGVIGAGGTALRVHEALPSGSTLTGSASTVTYNPDGTVVASATFTLNASGCTGNQKRIISVSATGRPSVATAACP